MSIRHRAVFGLLVVCVATVGPVQRASAHVNGGCPHVHDSIGNSACSAGATCPDGDCLEKGWGSIIQCVCQIIFAYNFQLVYSFTPEIAGLPTENTTIAYAAFSAEINAAQVLLGGDLLGFFGPEEAALTGSFTLSFGSFADPENIPVSVDEMFLRMPSVAVNGMPTGITIVTVAEPAATAAA